MSELNDNLNKLKCAYCGTAEGPWHKDHVVPRSRGGPDTVKNTVIACAGCNKSKSNFLPSEWMGEGNVPHAVFEIERAVSRTFTVSVRADRNRLKRTNNNKLDPERQRKSELLCRVCKKDVAAAYRLDQRQGWISWWLDENSVAQKVAITCWGDCFHRLEPMYKNMGLRVMDGHFRHFCGEYAMPQLWRMMWDYKWTRKSSCELLDTLVILGRLPTNEEARQDMVDE